MKRPLATAAMLAAATNVALAAPPPPPTFSATSTGVIVPGVPVAIDLPVRDRYAPRP